MKSSIVSERLCCNSLRRLAVVGSGMSCTYEAIHRGVWGLSRQLREMGVKKGSRVALWGYNSIQSIRLKEWPA